MQKCLLVTIPKPLIFSERSAYKWQKDYATNMNRYIRHMAIDGCVFKVDHTPIDNMNYELNKISANINQIAYKVNGTGSIYESDMKNLSEAMKTIWQLLKSTLFDD